MENETDNESIKSNSSEIFKMEETNRTVTANRLQSLTSVHKLNKISTTKSICKNKEETHKSIDNYFGKIQISNNDTNDSKRRKIFVTKIFSTPKPQMVKRVNLSCRNAAGDVSSIHQTISLNRSFSEELTDYKDDMINVRLKKYKSDDVLFKINENDKFLFNSVDDKLLDNCSITHKIKIPELICNQAIIYPSSHSHSKSDIINLSDSESIAVRKETNSTENNEKEKDLEIIDNLKNKEKKEDCPCLVNCLYYTMQWCSI